VVLGGPIAASDTLVATVVPAPKEQRPRQRRATLRTPPHDGARERQQPAGQGGSRMPLTGAALGPAMVSYVLAWMEDDVEHDPLGCRGHEPSPQPPAPTCVPGVRALPTFLSVDALDEEVERSVGDQPGQRIALMLAEVRGEACTAPL